MSAACATTPACVASAAAACSATAAASGSVPQSSGVCSASRSASDLAGFMNASLPGALRSASPSRVSASSSRPGESGVGSRSSAATAVSPTANAPRQVEARRHRDARLHQPHPARPRGRDRPVGGRGQHDLRARRHRPADGLGELAVGRVGGVRDHDVQRADPARHGLGEHDGHRAHRPEQRGEHDERGRGRARPAQQDERAGTVPGQLPPSPPPARRARWSAPGRPRWPPSAARPRCPGPRGPARRRAGCRRARSWVIRRSVARPAAAPGCRLRTG